MKSLLMNSVVIGLLLAGAGFVVMAAVTESGWWALAALITFIFFYAA